MFNKKLGMIFGLSLCCLVGCTSNNSTVSSVAEKEETQIIAPTEVKEEISTEIEVSLEDLETIEDATKVNDELVESKATASEIVLDSESIADEDSTLEVYLEADGNVKQDIAEVTDEAELLEEDVNEVISSIGTITAIEDNMILVSVDNASETYAQISEDTVCDFELAVGDRVEVKHSMIEMRSLPGIWPQVYEVIKLAE